uniref:Tyrosine-protein phosphatase domain-containing protein n=1 Tax=Parastrongyloides trichosuri TaxID=131310 RepID=A0A0N4Z9G1_PARTI
MNTTTNMASSQGDKVSSLLIYGIIVAFGICLFCIYCLLNLLYSRKTTEFTKVWSPSNVSVQAKPNRIITFGEMPSYGEEKRRKETNKRVFKKLNRVTASSTPMNLSQVQFSPFNDEMIKKYIKDEIIQDYSYCSTNYDPTIISSIHPSSVNHIDNVVKYGYNSELFNSNIENEIHHV